LAILLGIYQWYELIQIRSGGTAPLCSISSNINCVAVWNSPLADKIHNITGIPFAGWGIAWAAIVFLFAAELIRLARKGMPTGVAVLALRLTTAGGALISLALLGYSVTIGVYCPTCVLFYLLVFVSAAIVFRLPKEPAARWLQALLQSGGLLIICFALLLYPGRHTPQQSRDLASLDALNQPASAATPGEDPLAKFLLSLPPQAQQLVSDARALYRTAPLIDHAVDSNRLITGTVRSPVHLIDWIDIRCPHCKHLEEALAQIRQATPANSWSEEGRQFPLDSECNPEIARSDGTHVACLAAKVLICLGGSPRGHEARAAFFEKQGHLDVDDIWRIAADSEEQRQSLQACVSSQATADLLQDDINYAAQHRIEGTPLVVINGRQAPGFPPFIYAMIIAGGDSNAAGFRILPPPRNNVLEH
jgi:serine/threonine-protein kinase